VGEQLAGAQARAVAACEVGEERADGQHIGGDEGSEQRDAQIAHTPWAQLGDRHGEHQDHEQQRG